jgi:hypothetical protein
MAWEVINMHTKEYYTRGNFKALNQFYHELGHTFHHALLWVTASAVCGDLPLLQLVVIGRRALHGVRAAFT